MASLDTYLPIRPRARQPNPQSSLTPKTNQWQLGTSLMFYYIRSVCDYAIPVFHASLLEYVPNRLFEVCAKEGSLHHMPHLIRRQRSSFVRPRVTSGSLSEPMSFPFRKYLEGRDHRLQDFDIKFKLKGPGIVLVSIAVA